MYTPVPTLDLLLRCLQQAWSTATVAQIAALPLRHQIGQDGLRFIRLEM